MSDDLIERLRNARDLGDDLGAFDAAIDALAAAQARLAELEEADGCEWFWRIADAGGLADLPSDEAEALRLLMTRAARLAEVEQNEERLVCTGCACTDTIEQIRATSPRASSCCPEREMIPVKDLWWRWVEAGARAKAVERERDAARAAFERFSDWIPADMAGRIGIAAEWCALADLMRPALSGDAHA